MFKHVYGKDLGAIHEEELKKLLDIFAVVPVVRKMAVDLMDQFESINAMENARLGEILRTRADRVGQFLHDIYPVCDKAKTIEYRFGPRLLRFEVEMLQSFLKLSDIRLLIDPATVHSLLDAIYGDNVDYSPVSVGEIKENFPMFPTLLYQSLSFTIHFLNYNLHGSLDGLYILTCSLKDCISTIDVTILKKRYSIYIP